MKTKVLIPLLIAMGLMVASVAQAVVIENIEGRRLFKDTKFNSSQHTCIQCHQFGEGLELSYASKSFSVMGHTATNLEDAINLCIENFAKGKPIARESAEMKALVSLIKEYYKPNYKKIH